MNSMSRKRTGGLIQCRAIIRGSYKGQPFEYIDPEGDEGSQFIHPDGDPSEYWWTEGNMSCDCTRVKFLGATPKTHPELFGPEGDELCGESIVIDSVTPLDASLPALHLNPKGDAQ